MRPALVVEDLHKSFGRQAVLRDVRLTVGEGSLTAILGASGSGKTTLLRVVAGFERADAGRIVLGGRTVDDGSTFTPPERRRVGYVPQDGSLFPHLTVAANVAFGRPTGHRRTGHGRWPGHEDRLGRHGHGRWPDRQDPVDRAGAGRRGRRRAGRHGGRRRVDDLLEMVGLGGYGHRYAHELSGGQRQRVALARALAVEPDIVLLDEPFSSLDAAMRSTVRAEVLDVLRRAGTTAVLVTHDQDEALSVADSVAVLREGVIVQHGRPELVYGRPVDADVARFVGQANLLAGEWVGDSVRCALGLVGVDERQGPATGRALVLVRPESLAVAEAPEAAVSGAAAGPAPGPGAGGRPPRTEGRGGPGVPGTVVSRDFHGHDVVLQVRLVSEVPGTPPVGADGAGSEEGTTVAVRLQGDQGPAPGRSVRVRVSGPTFAWSTAGPGAGPPVAGPAPDGAPSDGGAGPEVGSRSTSP